MHLYFLGGHDLEMLTIRDLLESVDAPFYDRELSWGAHVQDYATEIAAAHAEDQTPVLIELEGADTLPEPRVIIDHHGKWSDRPSSLRQVFDHLERPASDWTRHFALVAANDEAYIPGMQALGASEAELRHIRALDRQSQGITPEQEAAAETAIAKREPLLQGRITLIRLPHARCATVTDRMHPALDGPGTESENLLIISPDETNFFGEGRIIKHLAAALPGGWYGGNLPQAGFWGHKTASLPEIQNLLQTLDF